MERVSDNENEYSAAPVPTAKGTAGKFQSVYQHEIQQRQIVDGLLKSGNYWDAIYHILMMFQDYSWAESIFDMIPEEERNSEMIPRLVTEFIYGDAMTGDQEAVKFASKLLTYRCCPRSAYEMQRFHELWLVVCDQTDEETIGVHEFMSRPRPETKENEDSNAQ